MKRLLLFGCLAWMLGGCFGYNANRIIRDDETINSAPDTSFILIGAEVPTGSADLPMNATFYKFDILSNSADGDCSRWDLMHVRVPSSPSGGTRYFLFRATPGAYLTASREFVPWSGPGKKADWIAFEASAGEVVYFGDLRRGNDGILSINRDADGAKSALARHPGAPHALVSATLKPVEAPAFFVCMP